MAGMRRKLAKGLLIGAFLLWAGTAPAADAIGAKPGAAAIASAHPLATAAGLEILDAGGNAFDAAVAVSAALAVVEPYSSGLGGGGFWLLHRAADGFEVMVDGRERAPLAAHRDLYLDEQGEVVRDGSMNGPLSAAIPGEPAALDHLARHYGKLSLARSLAPAIRFAREGFAVDEHYRRMAEFRLEVMARYPETAAILLDHGAVPEVGMSIVQEDLARTLEALAEQGAAGFYRGPVAQRLVKAVRAAGGIWTRDDLEQYRVVEREPVRFHYRGLQVTTAAPPSSGGVALATMLHILERDDLEALDAATRTHLVVEAMRRAYRDRAEYLGDPDFVDMPLARLTSRDYAAGLRAGIRADRATPSAHLPGTTDTGGGHHTTHFSILDREGNRVAATLSVNYPFGSGFIAPGTGVLLNDEMDDFSAKPGVPNAYGLVGAEANAIAPGKRPLSSMSPTFVETADRVAILGTPGGSRIITMVLLGILEFARGEPPESWVTRPRFHHQFLPDQVEYEAEALSQSVIEALQARGHVLKAVGSPYGNMQAVLWDRRDGSVRAAADPRGLGAAEVR
jgi:gamma-glutamyltranspeptidase / glutathione hydrolase